MCARSREVLQLSPGVDVLGSVVWQLALCLLVAWVTVFLVLLKGIASLGKVRPQGTLVCTDRLLPQVNHRRHLHGN